MKERLDKLLAVKSLVTLALTAGFVFLGVTGKVTPAQYLAIFTTVVGFYFGTQKVKE